MLTYEKSRLLPELMATINAGFDFFANVVNHIIHINWGGWITKGFNTVANALRVVNILLVNFVAMFQEIIGPRVKNAEYLGVKWKVSAVEIMRPRLLLTLGGEYVDG